MAAKKSVALGRFRVGMVGSLVTRGFVLEVLGFSPCTGGGRFLGLGALAGVVSVRSVGVVSGLGFFPGWGAVGVGITDDLVGGGVSCVVV